MPIIQLARAIFTPTGDILAVINEPELNALTAAKPATEITTKRKILCLLILIKELARNKTLKFSQP